MNIEKFRIDVDAAALVDLTTRLERTRWNDSVSADWDYGTESGALHNLIAYWRREYDWRAREVMLNRLPHFRATIDGFGIHFLHFRGRGPSPQPLLLMNGWPSSFIEYQRLAPMLADPGRFGLDAAQSFDVVIPTLPGFGFSDRATRPHQVRAPDLFRRLMTEGLGYRRFAVAGTDIGAGVATRLAHEHPDHVTAVHVTTVVDPPIDSRSLPFSPAERDYIAQGHRWDDEEGAYSAIQSTRPQTLAFGLTDSPVGMASWIVEKFYFWSDCGGNLGSVFPTEALIDNLMVYWVTKTIGSSVRHYYETRRWARPFKPGDRVQAPTALLVLPKELAQAPREWAERFYNVQRYNVSTHGGHFPAWEVPALYARDLQEFFHQFR